MLNYANTAVLALLISFIFSFAKPYKDEVIVFYKNGYTPQSIKGLSIKKSSESTAVLKVPKGKTVEETIKDLKKDPSVALAIPNYIIKKQAIPNDPYYQYQWYLKKINMENAWDISIDSSDVYVAVLDTGVDYNHIDLINNIWLNDKELTCQDLNKNGIDDGCENNTDDDSNGYIDDCYGYNAIAGKGSALDDDGHGTHVSGMIGAVGNNSIGIAGINWNVKIVPCKFLDSSGYGDLDGLLECLKYVKKLKDNGLNIVAVNESLGYTGYASDLNIDCSNPSYKDTEKCLMQSINALFTVASGNGGNDLIGDNNDTQTFLPCNYSTVLNNVICVGSTNSNDEKSSFSNYGAKTVNIFAPGGEITSSNGCDTSNGILSTWMANDYTCAIGTSQSAPIIAGAIALLKASEPNLTLQDIKKRILTTGDNLLSLTGYSTTCNRINVYNALVDEKSPKICFNQNLALDSNGYFYDISNLKSGDTVPFVLKNTGNDTLSIGEISLQNSTDFSIIYDNCSNSNLNTFENCNFNLKVEIDNPTEDILLIPTNTIYNTIQITLKKIIATNSVVKSQNILNSNVKVNNISKIQKTSMLESPIYQNYCPVVITQLHEKNSSGCCFSEYYNNSLFYIFAFITIILLKRLRK